MNAKRWLRAVYAEIPTADCPAGCVNCCGPIVWTRTEWLRVPAADRARAYGGRQTQTEPPATGVSLSAAFGEATAADRSLACRFAIKGLGCTIYDHRPLLCRLMAVVDRMRCPKLPDAPMMDARRAFEIGGRYMDLVEEGR